MIDVEDEERGMKNSWGRSGAHVSRSDVEDRDRDLKSWIPCSECFRQACLEDVGCDKLRGILVPASC